MGFGPLSKWCQREFQGFVRSRLYNGHVGNTVYNLDFMRSLDQAVKGHPFSGARCSAQVLRDVEHRTNHTGLRLSMVLGTANWTPCDLRSPFGKEGRWVRPIGLGGMTSQIFDSGRASIVGRPRLAASAATFIPERSSDT